jgi:hypothetical protein
MSDRASKERAYQREYKRRLRAGESTTGITLPPTPVEERMENLESHVARELNLIDRKIAAFTEQLDMQRDVTRRLRAETVERGWPEREAA